MSKDEKYIQETFALALRTQERGDHPFGALIVSEDGTVIEGVNTGLENPTGHAEVNAIKQAVKELGKNLYGCTLYTNFEPCAMCSFLARDHNISRIVFSVYSPHWGGYSRWNILESPISNSLFTSAKETHVPEVVGGVLEDEGNKIFGKLGWKMHISGSD